MSVPADQMTIPDQPLTTDITQSVREGLPEVDTSINPDDFASGGVEELAPPEDISSEQIGEYTPYTAVTGEVDPNSTVEGRLSGLLSQNNPYIERARTAGKQYANRRGMLNSSMAAGAAEGAAIDRALPIAQQDAQAHLEQQFLNQGYSNDEAKTLAEQSVTRENLQATMNQDTNQFNAEQDFEAAKINAAETNKNNFQVLTADLKGELARIDNGLAMNLESLAQEYSILENLDTINGAIYKELVQGISTIIANTEDVNEAKARVNALIDATGAELAFSTGQTLGTEELVTPEPEGGITPIGGGGDTGTNQSGEGNFGGGWTSGNNPTGGNNNGGGGTGAGNSPSDAPGTPF
jgi:hypothetical protein